MAIKTKIIFYLYILIIILQAKYKFIGKKHPKTVRPKKASIVVKPIGGEKNGGTRKVLLRRRKAFYPTQEKYVSFIIFIYVKNTNKNFVDT